MRWGTAAAALTCLALVACGGDDPAPTDESTTTSTEVADDPEVGGEEAGGPAELCDAYQAIADLNDEVGGRTNELMSVVIGAVQSGDDAAAEAAIDEAMAELGGVIEDRLPDLLGAYDALTSLVPDDLVDDVETLEAFTDEFNTQLASVSDIDGFEALMGSMSSNEDALAAASAALALDEHSRENCDISITA